MCVCVCVCARWDRCYLRVVVLSGLVRVGDLAVQAEQRRLLQGENGGQRRLLQRVEGVLLSAAAAHRECRGHEAPDAAAQMNARAVTQKGGCLRRAAVKGAQPTKWSACGGGDRCASVCYISFHLFHPLHRPADSFLSVL